MLLAPGSLCSSPVTDMRCVVVVVMVRSWQADMRCSTCRCRAVRQHEGHALCSHQVSTGLRCTDCTVRNYQRHALLHSSAMHRCGSATTHLARHLALQAYWVVHHPRPRTAGECCAACCALTQPLVLPVAGAAVCLLCWIQQGGVV